MNNSLNSSLPMSATVIRWVARILSVMIMLFWGYFMVAHFVGEGGRSSRPLTANDYISLAMIAVSLLGLAVAFKKELAGGVLTLAAVLVGAVVNWKSLYFPATLIPIAALLFLSCWWISTRRRDDNVAMNPIS